MRKMKVSADRRVPRLIGVLAALVILTAVLLAFLPRRAEGDYALTLDGSAWRGGTAAAGRESGLRVIVTLDGREIDEDFIVMIDDGREHEAVFPPRVTSA